MISKSVFLFLVFTTTVNSQIDKKVKSEILQCQYDPVYIDLKQSKLLGKSWKRDKEKYISPYQLYQQISKGKAYDHPVIDVRSKRAFKQFHIKGALNISMFSLSTMSFYKHKKIVIAGTGSDYKQLEKLQENLTASGFKDIKILDGGMNYWQSKIKSKRLGQKEYQLDNLSKLFQGDRSKWKIVDASSNDKIVEQFPNVISLVSQQAIYKPDSFTKTLVSKKGLIENVLLVLPEKDNNRAIVDLWQSKLKANIYVIDAKNMLVAANQYASKKRLGSYKRRTDGAKMACL